MATGKTKKRTIAKKKTVRKSSQKRNPVEPVGTATERVHQYWRTPRFKKDRAWLEEHLGQQKLFQYNPATVRVEKVGKAGYGVMIGKQLVGKPGTKAEATRRATALKATAKRFEKKAAAASPKKAMRSKAVKKNSLAVRPSRLHVINITPGNFGVFLGKYLLKGKFKTKAAADVYLNSILRRKKNPAPGTIAADVGRAFLKTFDVNRDGELNSQDLAILQHFNDRRVVIDPKTNRVGRIIEERPKHGEVDVRWADGQVSTEFKTSLYEQNGVKSWIYRHRAARQYRKALKHSERASKAKRRQSELESRIKNPADKKEQKDLAEFKRALHRLTLKTADHHDLQAAMQAGKRAGYKQDEVWRLVKKAWNAAAKKSPKRNPGIISMLAEIAVGTAAALDIKSRLAAKKDEKRKPANKAAKRKVPNPSQKKPAVRNSPAFTDFQGRPSGKTLTLVTPPGTPKNLWCLGQLLELRVKGYGNLDLARGRFYLCADERNKKLYIAGGRIFDAQRGLKDGQLLPVGELTHVVYLTEKTHLGDGPGDPTPYIHRLGEEGGERPVLAVDNQGYGHLEGGSYTITPLGIRD
jgi:hypothetical protein